MSKARNLSDFISDATIDSTEIADLSVTHAKLHTDMNLSSKTLTFAANQISGNSVDGGVISNFASTGIDDNASATAVTILSSGNVGIGTAAPNSLLSINNSSDGDRIEFQVGGTVVGKIGTAIGRGLVFDADPIPGGAVATTMQFRIDNAERMRIDSSGNVGINSTNPSAKLTVEGTFSVRTSSNQSFNDSSNANNLTMTDSKAHFNIDGADKDFQVSSDTVTHSLFVQGSDGKVGIGIDNPLSPLHVFSGEIGNGANKGIRISNNSASQHYSIRTGITGSENHSLAIYDDTAGANRMVISNGGNVGIGTSSPSADLDIKRTAGDNNDILRVGSTDNYYHGFARSNTTGALSIQGNQTNFNNILLAPTSGNVGIGTTSPSDKLDIQGADNGLTIRSVSANRPVISLINGSSTMLKISANGTYGAIGDGTDANRYMSFRAGNVGIGGQINPSYPLDVTGDTIQNGVRTFTARFNVLNNASISFDVAVPNEGGGGNSFMIHCGHNHYYITSYGTHRIAMVSARGTNLSDVINVGHQTSGNGGTWDFSKPSANILRITKTAGTYGGGGAGFVHVVFSSFM